VSTSTDDFSILDRRYLGVTNIPYFVDEDGRVLLDRAWHHDLVQHFAYLPDFSLAAPRLAAAARPDLVPLEADSSKRMNCVPLPAPTSRARALLDLPRTFLTIWRAVGQSDIVHAGIAGWPYPLGWLAIPVARVRGKKIVVIVESAPWRRPANAGHPTLRKRLEAAVYETLGRWGCSLADVSFYTQSAYREQFHAAGRGAAFVAPATWVNAEDVLDDGQAEASWNEKMRHPVRFLFAGRWVAEKGIEILLAAAQTLVKAGVNGSLDFIGDGPLRPEIMAAAANTRGGPFVLRHFEPIPSGKPFLDFLQTYHVAIIPSLTDEQPRIVFDAAARAVAVLASDTDGLRPHVDHQRTGILVPPGNPAALAQAMVDMVKDRSGLRAMATEALRQVRNRTHRAMHVERSRVLAQHLL
jgi:glycosyltransferase involved in cell wall biosynthesis